MPFVKDDPNINKLDTLPEKFTKEFVDYVCHLYSNNTSILEMSEILNTPQNTIKKYLKKLITEERTRLEQLKESMYGVC